MIYCVFVLNITRHFLFAKYFSRSLHKLDNRLRFESDIVDNTSQFWDRSSASPLSMSLRGYNVTFHKVDELIIVLCGTEEHAAEICMYRPFFINIVVEEVLVPVISVIRSHCSENASSNSLLEASFLLPEVFGKVSVSIDEILGSVSSDLFEII